MRLLVASLVTAASLMAAPASAKSYRIGVSAIVPVECELSTSGDVEAVSPSTYRIARVDQFCNTGFKLEVRSAQLSSPSIASFRGEIADVTSGSATLIAAGRPVNGAADLFLNSTNASDAALFAQTLWLQISPTGV